MESGNTIWVILGVIVAIVVPISVFAGNQIAKKRQVEKDERERKLRIHFEDIKKEVINHISEVARNLTIRHERLVTSYAPIGECYPFTKHELYKCFELHFPEEAKEWKALNKKAVKLNEHVVNFFQSHQYSHAASKQNVAVSYIRDLQQEFSNFNQRLARKVESIDKYEMGNEFKKHRECPICKKF